MPEVKYVYKITEEPMLIRYKLRMHSGELLIEFLLGIALMQIFANWTPELLSHFFTTTNVDLLTHFYSIEKSVQSQLPATPIAAILFAVVFNGVINMGQALYTLTFIRNRKIEYSALLESASFWLKAFGVYIAQTVLVAMWSMLFIIPGVIVAINFSMSYFILADNPDKRVFEILAESKINMLGNRMQYVRLLLSYLPYLACGYAIPMLVSLIPAINTETLGGLLIVLAASIPFYFANGYLLMGKSVFYELLMSGGFDNFKYVGQDAFRENIEPID